MPNLLPDWLPWFQPAGRLIWSSLMLVVGVLFVLALMKPPVLTRPFPDGVGYALFAVVPIVGWVVAVLIPDDAAISGWEVDALVVVVVLATLVAHGLLMVASRPSRPADHRASWPACYLGAVGVFALMTLAYGVIPHEWMEFANGYLEWGDTSAFIWQSSQDMLFFPWSWPFSFDYPALRDIVVSGIYLVMLGANVVLFVRWQARTKVPEAPKGGEAAPVRRSRFGRPIRRAAAVATGEGA